MPRIHVESRVAKLVRIYDFLSENGPTSAWHIGEQWGSSPKHFHRWLQALARVGIVECLNTRPPKWRITRRYTDRRRAIDRIGEHGGEAVLLRAGRRVAAHPRSAARARVAAMKIVNPHYMDGIEKYFDDVEEA